MLEKDNLFNSEEMEKVQKEAEQLIEQLKGKSLSDVKYLFERVIYILEHKLIVYSILDTSPNLPDSLKSAKPSD